MRFFVTVLVFFLCTIACNKQGADGNSESGDVTKRAEESADVASEVEGEGEEAEGVAIKKCQPSDLEKVSPAMELYVPDEHRSCETVADCAAIYINCSVCGGGCTGVHATCAEAYAKLLECSGYEGPECDYDCHPTQGLTTLACVEGLCTVVE